MGYNKSRSKNNFITKNEMLRFMLLFTFLTAILNDSTGATS
jgi:hypothetical protein